MHNAPCYPYISSIPDYALSTVLMLHDLPWFTCSVSNPMVDNTQRYPFNFANSQLLTIHRAYGICPKTSLLTAPNPEPQLFPNLSKGSRLPLTLV